MTLWPVSAQACEPPRHIEALAAVVAGIGAPGFAPALLQGLQAVNLPAASLSVYQLWPQRPPCLHLSASLGVADTTRDCFAAYQQGLYRADRSFDAVRPGASAVLRMHADDAPSTQHRELIYRRHGMLERLSVVHRADAGSLLAVNLYRHNHQPRWADAELAGFAGLAPLLLAAVQRHLAWPGPATPAAMSAPPPAPAPAPAHRDALRQRCAALTPRELDVCERLLRGWTYDGIAADLGLTVATVKTYRARAFDRLGLHFKSELFAALLPSR